MKEKKNENETLFGEENVHRVGFLNEFFWICSGANRRILRQCPTDWAKYAGIGGTILFTALMASLSGGYAMYTVFRSERMAILLGVFWGLLIFNLDRFIVNTMYSDGKVTISWREFYSGLPRVIMAIFLGVVISTPLELKIYEDGINNEIEALKREELKERTRRIDDEIAKLEKRREDIGYGSNGVSAGSGGLVSEHGELGQQELQLENKLRKLQEQIRAKDNELSNYSAKDTLKSRKCEEQLRTLRNERNRVSHEIKDIQYQMSTINTEYGKLVREADARRNAEIAAVNERINELTKKRDNQESTDVKMINEELTGFQGRMRAFNRMKAEDPSTRIAALFIALLFIIIETAPTFFKMMIASGPYDDRLRAEMHRVRVLSDKAISDINDEVNTRIQISSSKNKERMEAEVIANKKIMEQISVVQAELLNTAIEHWRAEELEKIKSNPSQYIVANSTESNEK